jgi:RNA-directed DNA polymerase
VRRGWQKLFWYQTRAGPTSSRLKFTIADIAKTGPPKILGVPTVGDRIAQMVVKRLIEPDLDPIFLPDSYGYRPRKSALDAVGVTRVRCWKYDWVLEFDIKGLFDNPPHDLLMKAVRKRVTCKWAILYIEKWLMAPIEKDNAP